MKPRKPARFAACTPRPAPISAGAAIRRRGVARRFLPDLQGELAGTGWKGWRWSKGRVGAQAPLAKSQRASERSEAAEKGFDGTGCAKTIHLPYRQYTQGVKVGGPQNF